MGDETIVLQFGQLLSNGLRRQPKLVGELGRGCLAARLQTLDDRTASRGE